MKPGTALALRTAIFLIVLSPAPMRAHDLVSLDLCNNGTVPGVVLTAMKHTDLARGIGKYYWGITSTVVTSGECKSVYINTGSGAYLGFGFVDAKGHWGSGNVSQVPDIGRFNQWFQNWPVLSRGEGKIEACVPMASETYVVKDDPKTDCATLQLTPSDDGHVVHGPFFPVTSALYFEDGNPECADSFQHPIPCVYHLNISPNATDRELHATQGLGGGADAPPALTNAEIAKAIADMIAKLDKYKPQAPPSPPPPPKREPTVTISAPAHDGYAIKMDPSLSAVLAGREQEKWKSPTFMVSAYEPKWIGQTLVLKGTVSRVEVESDGDPKWVHIYFKESPDATITGCSPFPDMLRKMFGNDLSSLLGKTIEMAGQVEKFCRPNISIRIVDRAQIKLVN